MTSNMKGQGSQMFSMFVQINSSLFAQPDFLWNFLLHPAAWSIVLDWKLEKLTAMLMIMIMKVTMMRLLRVWPLDCMLSWGIMVSCSMSLVWSPCWHSDTMTVRHLVSMHPWSAPVTGGVIWQCITTQQVGHVPCHSCLPILCKICKIERTC